MPLLPFQYSPGEIKSKCSRKFLPWVPFTWHYILSSTLVRKRILMSSTIRKKSSRGARAEHVHNQSTHDPSALLRYQQIILNNKHFPSMSRLTACQTKETSKLHCNSFGTGLRVHRENSLERVAVCVCACVYIIIAIYKKACRWKHACSCILQITECDWDVGVKQSSKLRQVK